VNAAEVATPLALVVAVVTPPANVPLAPVVAGAVNVTVAPLTGVVPVITVATSGFVNAVPTVALCPPPLVATIVSTGGGGAELELQPVQKTKAKQIRARMLA
jgi:hypothetical protein